MEGLIATLSGWLQSSTGMTIKDLTLFAGAILMVLALLWLGIYSGRPRYREAARFGWFLLFAAASLIAFGLYHHTSRPG